jgi:hypothetical protein
MALLRIAIEQLAPDRFVAEIELGRRDSLRATTLDDIVRGALARVAALIDEPGIGQGVNPGIAPSITSAPMQQGAAAARLGGPRPGVVTPRAAGSR